jgi:hypothetical protein
MTVRARQPASAPSKNRMGGNEELTDFKGKKMENFANTNAFDKGKFMFMLKRKFCVARF